uniref:(California timema) hypothetical protein n=1 Tax=Timema californicum TaxID=61474 RepID=A0A7R9P7K1_TIMCA|nr:unnamed protein product [Timema californicum]
MLYFPVRGHSFLTCKRYFGVIKRYLNNINRVDTPDQYARYIVEASKKGNFCVNYSMFVFNAKSLGNVCTLDFIDRLQQYTFRLLHKTDDSTIRKENAAFVVPWIIGFITFMALEAVAMVYSNVLRDHVNKQFDALCKAEMAFFISRAFLNIISLYGVMQFYNMLRMGISWKGPEAIELLGEGGKIAHITVISADSQFVIRQILLTYWIVSYATMLESSDWLVIIEWRSVRGKESPRPGVSNPQDVKGYTRLLGVFLTILVIR